ncbi:DUF1996 domain-containing protein [Sphingomonas sp. BK069]|uniref:DUF1996 domain-containing protein n=1 Tax=Sphingomonas sp. BK069 TaxID=2586979 RepID=UPI00160D0C7E|nr:DUF1996 domain-containing protein [Sphingomonas sp. BK069]MBB3347304.1 hypothetical protein [Sphingomonas sp. BK069]
MIRSLLAAAFALLAASPAYAADTCATPADAKVATSTDTAALNKGVACRTARIKGRQDTIIGLQAANKVDAEQVAARVARLAALAAPPKSPLTPKPPVVTSPPAPPAPTPTPSASQGNATQPIPGGTVAVGLPSIASNFPTAGLLEPAYQTGVLGAIPPSGVPDVVGAFRFICTAGQIARDDPIVFPGQPGQSHLHQFFGNTGANAFSTFNTLRTSGDSTCTNRLNRSAYWVPAMLNGKGGVVRPDFVSIYYKRRPAADPECQRMGKACVALPRGLRFVFGYDMVSGKAPTGHGYFNCQGNGAKEGHYADIVEAASHCQIGSQLGLIINAPNCWNGKDLDSPNHRDHVAYSEWTNFPTGTWEACPATHPYVIPTFTLGGWYTVDADLDRSGTWDAKRPTWSLSSDDMSAMGHGMMRPGSTLHADWWGAWDDDTMARWTANCIDKLLNCNGGNLGDGWQMKQEGPPLTYKAEPRVVPVPTI